MNLRYWPVHRASGAAKTRGVDIARALCPSPPPDDSPPLPPIGGPFDAVSDGLRRLHFDAYVAAAREELTGKARKRREHQWFAGMGVP